MDEAVLVHTQIDESAKGGHVADGAFEHHAFFQVGNVVHAFVEARHLKAGARVAAGFFQLGKDVAHGDGAKLRRGKLLGLECFEHFGAAHELVNGLAGAGDDLLYHGVGFGVHAGHVQRVVAAAYAQKARALLEGFGTQARDFEQLLAVAECAVLLAPAHDGFGHGA